MMDTPDSVPTTQIQAENAESQREINAYELEALFRSAAYNDWTVGRILDPRAQSELHAVLGDLTKDPDFDKFGTPQQRELAINELGRLAKNVGLGI